MIKEDNNLLREYTNMYFLRPENAIGAYRRALAMNNNEMNWKKGMNMDISCGDGVFSYIAAGGKFNEFFDMFINVDEKSITDLHTNRETDIFNNDYENYKNLGEIVKTKPDYNFSIGTDWKQSLLDKAERIGLYNKLILQDNNKTLNVDTESINNIYTNSIYWVDNIDLHIREIYRVLIENGSVLLQIKTNEIVNIHPTNLDLGIFSSSSLNIIDRGRLKSWKSIKKLEWWLKKFETNGFRVETVKPTFTKEQIMVWHYGFRPFAHTLVKVFNKLSIKERTENKKEIIESLFPIITDLAKLEPSSKDTFEYTIKLTK
tara:strand:- start:742 stop:1692 length:951 start_codon:yes stop_codon:yes gene_type:complete